MPQDFSGQNLRGRSFKGQNLAGANFSGADIRSTDFTGANLIGANFSHAKAGLEKRWGIYLPIILFLFVGLLGVFSYIANYLGLLIVKTPELESKIIVSTTFILLTTFFITTISQGLETGLKVFTLIGGITVVFSAGIKLVPAFTGAATGVLVVALTILGSVAIAVSIAASSKTLVLIASIIVILAVLASVVTLSLQFISNTIGVILITVALAVALFIALFIALSSIYFGYQAIEGNKKYFWIRTIAIAWAATGGTSFHETDLTNAIFTKAVLRSADFRKANLMHTNFYQVKMLDCAELDKTYLQNSQVRNLLITGQGQNQIFDRQNLRGVNLKGANLADASFIGADLSEANLQDADLSRAKVVQTQLDSTDFTGATLTGVYIQDWGITTNTKFDGVQCEYVYMRLPTKENPDPHRKPDNRQEVFALGEFGDFIKPIFDTLDLYHSQAIDPRAIAISFKQLAENHPEADLRIVGMEVRGENKFLLRAKTAAEAGKSELSAEYFEIYNQLKALAQQELQALISEKDSRIRSLETMVVTALQSPQFYAENYNNHGDTIMSEGAKKQSNFNLQGAQFAGGLVNADTVNAEQIGGNMTNYTPDQKPIQIEANKVAVKTILILASNPVSTSPLRLDQEVREIDTGLQRAKKRELFDLKQRWAVRVQDVYQSFLDLKPQIVHFSGHGAGDDGLVFQDETGNVQLVDTAALARLFQLFATSIECILLNACYSEVQAQAIANHIPYVIGMSKEIGDQAAIKFATGFYNALGAGESIEFAYKLGCNVIQLEGIPEHLTPVLRKKQ